MSWYLSCKIINFIAHYCNPILFITQTYEMTRKSLTQRSIYISPHVKTTRYNGYFVQIRSLKAGAHLFNRVKKVCTMKGTLNGHGRFEICTSSFWTKYRAKQISLEDDIFARPCNILYLFWSQYATTYVLYLSHHRLLKRPIRAMMILNNAGLKSTCARQFLFDSESGAGNAMVGQRYSLDKSLSSQ